jgi:hypothetical protein
LLVGIEATIPFYDIITNAHFVTEGGQTSKAQATKIHLSMLTESDFVFIDESVNDASFINLYSVKTGLEALIRRIHYFTNNKVKLIKLLPRSTFL